MAVAKNIWADGPTVLPPQTPFACGGCAYGYPDRKSLLSHLSTVRVCRTRIGALYRESE